MGKNVVFLTLTLFIIALGLAFVVGWMIGRQHPPTKTLPPGISFQIDIPADTPPGDTIYLTGSFNDWNPADPEYVFTRTADIITGTWEFPNSPLVEYKVTRGAWSNVEKGSGHNELPNHVFVPAPGLEVKGHVTVWADQNYASDYVYDERVERVDLLSEALGVTKTFYVYVPPEVRTTESLRVPSVYLLRGHEREWINKHEDGSRKGQSNVIDVYEELRAAGEIGPLVLVFPGMTSSNGSVHSLGINMLAADKVSDSSIGTGRFEDYMFNDLIPYVEANYPVLPGGEHRAIDGFSLGGFMSVNMALRKPGSFQSVGSYDGLFFWDDPDQGMTIATTDTVFTRPLFDSNFGVPRDLDFAALNNPITILHRDGQHAEQIQWLIEYGPEHAEPNVNYYRGVRLIEMLHEHGIVNDLNGSIPDGIHSWTHADDHMRRAFPLHWEKIKP